MKHTAITGNISLSRYHTDINGCPVNPDVLIFRGREALSEPFRGELNLPRRTPFRAKMP